MHQPKGPIVFKTLILSTLLFLSYTNELSGQVTALFSYEDTIGCGSINTRFIIDRSASTDSIVSTKWFLGFGAEITDQDTVERIFATTGSYNIRLIVFSNTDSDTLELENLIDVFEAPTANFSLTDSVFCTLPAQVNFNNSSSVDASSFEWSFSNNTSSSLENPQAIFTSNGSYSIGLKVENDAGCKDSIFKPAKILVDAIESNATTDKANYCSSEIVSFNQSASNVDVFDWSFSCCGNFNTSSGAFTLPDNVFSTQSYTFIASNANGCTDTVSASFFVDTIKANLTTNQTLFCEAPYTLSFSDASNALSNVSSWQWVLNGADTSHLENPAFFVTNQANNSIELTVNSSLGCSDQITQSNVARWFNLKPIIDTTSSTIGCPGQTIGLQINNTANSYADSLANSNFIEWYVNGNSVAQNTFSFPFLPPALNPLNNPGEHTVVLESNFSNGCTRFDSIRYLIGDTPVANFSINKLDDCASSPVDFIDQSTSSTPITEWFWNFGDSSTSALQNPTHLYTDTGSMNVSLKVSSNGCSDSVSVNDLLYISGPIVELTIDSVDCDNPLQLNASVNIKGGDRWAWYYGDDNLPKDSNATSISYDYLSSASYTVRVEAVNDSSLCINESSQNVVIYEDSLGLYLPIDTTCVQTPFNYSALGQNPAVQYDWYLGNGDSIIDVGGFQYRYDSAGSYVATLIAEYPNSCRDTVTHPIYVGAFQALFTQDNLQGCLPLNVQFTDQSISEFNITSYEWNFANGATDSIQNPNFTFTSDSIQPSVSLTIENDQGCRATFTNQVTNLFLPKANFEISSNALCLGNTIDFSNLSTNNSFGATTYTFDFGDGSDTATPASAQHTYSDTGQYDVTLSMLDLTYGCADTLTIENAVYIQDKPTAGFTVNNQLIGCASEPAIFTNLSLSDFQFGSFEWNFGDAIGTDTISNPQYNYTYPGTYSVSLIATTTSGCSDTIESINLIEVQGPYVELSLSKDSICKGEQVTFSIDSSNATIAYEIDFGDGDISELTNISTPTVEHSYSQGTGFYPIVLNMYSDTSTASECKVPILDSLYVYEVKADFSIDDSTLCSNNTVVSFLNTSNLADSLVWTIQGTTNTFTNVSNFNYDFSSANNTYQISLAVFNNAFGCSDTAVKTIEVSDQILDALLPGDTFVCQGDSIQLFTQADALDSVSWQSLTGAFIEDPNGFSTLLFDQNTSLNTVFLQDTNGCTLTDTFEVFAIQPFTLNALDTTQSYTILQNDSALFSIDLTPQENHYTYNFNPSTDLNCMSCPAPYIYGQNDQSIELIISDSLTCNTQTILIDITVLRTPSIALPSSFTPNGDLNNDVIYVGSNGITELLEFNIYNRWGERVYENPGDLSLGWNGFYKGKLQPIDAYGVTVKAKAFTGEILEYKGYINIIQ